MFFKSSKITVFIDSRDVIMVTCVTQKAQTIVYADGGNAIDKMFDHSLADNRCRSPRPGHTSGYRLTGYRRICLPGVRKSHPSPRCPPRPPRRCPIDRLHLRGGECQAGEPRRL